MDRRLSEVFFRTVLSQAGDDVFEQLFTQPEAMQYVLSRLGVQMELDEVKSHFVDGRYQPFEVRLLLNGDGPKVPVYDKPVIALTDGGCYSTTDICLKILQDFGRITIVGSPNGARLGKSHPLRPAQLQGAGHGAPRPGLSAHGQHDRRPIPAPWICPWR